MLHFDPQTGLFADTPATVREAVREDWKTAFRRDGAPELDTGPETPAGQLIDSETAAIVDKDNLVLFLANQFNPLTAQGAWQDALAKIYFLTRKVAQRSEALCRCNGLAGTALSIFLSRAFSSSSPHRRMASETSLPPYFGRHLLKVASEMPCLRRHKPTTRMPASAWRKGPMIRSSPN